MTGRDSEEVSRRLDGWVGGSRGRAGLFGEQLFARFSSLCPDTWGRFKGERAPGPVPQTSSSGKCSETQGDRSPEAAPLLPRRAEGEERLGAVGEDA